MYFSKKRGHVSVVFMTQIHEICYFLVYFLKGNLADNSQFLQKRGQVSVVFMAKNVGNLLFFGLCCVV